MTGWVALGDESVHLVPVGRSWAACWRCSCLSRISCASPPDGAPSRRLAIPRASRASTRGQGWSCTGQPSNDRHEQQCQTRSIRAGRRVETASAWRHDQEPACPGRAAGSRRLPATPRVADGPARRRGFIKRSNRGTFACARSPPVSLDAPSLKRSSSLFHRLFLDRLA